MILYLFRHGKTIANEQHLYCGSTDLSLSEQGRTELYTRSNTSKHLDTHTLAQVLSDIRSDADMRFVSSGMRRCNETLEILFSRTQYEIISAFREIDFGVFEMKSYEQLKGTPEYQCWISGDNFQNIAPNGESGAQMWERIIPALDNIFNNKSNTVLVTHGGVISHIMQYLFPEENKNIYQWQPKPGYGYKVIKNTEELNYEEIHEFYTG